MVGKIEDFLAARRRQQEAEAADENDAIGRMMVGQWARLEVPLASVYNLRRVAALLRDLAEELDFLSRQDDIPNRMILFQARESAREVNAKLRTMRRVKGEEA
jgi:hypothetical protein